MNPTVKTDAKPLQSVMYHITIGLPLSRGIDMGMHNPPHPGEILLEDVIPALGITITEMARRLGFARETLSRILHGRAPVSPDLAVRLERAGVSTGQLWLSMQSAYDLWQAEHREQPVIERFARFE